MSSNVKRAFGEKQIDWRNVNDVARRFALTRELLDVLDSHEVHADSDDEENTSEALAVFVATAAYLMVSFAVTEKDACDSFRRLFKSMKTAHKKLSKTETHPPTARDIFTEVALDTMDDP